MTNNLKQESLREEKRRKLFSDMPVWKALLVNSLPMVIVMLVFGAYTFVDSILAIQLAPDSYVNNATAEVIGQKAYIRLAMGAGGPITMLIMSISLFFALGTSVRVAINLGAKRFARAQNTLKTGFQFSLITSIIIIPILIFAAKPWMISQYPTDKFGTVVDDGYKYVFIMILSAPFQFFNQTLSSTFRVDGRLRAMMAAMILPILINLGFDWVMMGPVGMGVEGGAWATFISYGLTSLMFIGFIIKKKTDLISFKSLFGKFKAIAIVGISLVGISPFLRNFANSITQTTYFTVIQNVSTHVFNEEAQSEVNQLLTKYNDASSGVSASDFKYVNIAYINVATRFKDAAMLKNIAEMNKIGLTYKFDFVSTWLHSDISEKIREAMKLPAAVKSYQQLANITLTSMISGSRMSVFASGAFPVYTLFFPAVFGIVQGAGPLASYNYGAKQMKRLKKIYYWAIIYSAATSIFLYIMGAFALTYPLLQALGVKSENQKNVVLILRIIMTSMIAFSFAIAGMVILSSTDRIVLGTIASTINGFIFFFPIVYIFKAVAIANVDIWWLFWISSPILNVLTSITITMMTMYVMMNLHKSHLTLDERLLKMYAYFSNKKKIKKQNKTRQ